MPSFDFTPKPNIPTLQKQNVVPKSKNPLKSVNWTKISDSSQLEGTIWEKLDETKLYEKELNLTKVDKIFELVPLAQRSNLEVTKRVPKYSSSVIDAKR